MDVILTFITHLKAKLKLYPQYQYALLEKTYKSQYFCIEFLLYTNGTITQTLLRYNKYKSRTKM